MATKSAIQYVAMNVQAKGADVQDEYVADVQDKYVADVQDKVMKDQNESSCHVANMFSTMIDDMDSMSSYEEVDGDAIITTQNHKWLWSCYKDNCKVNCHLTIETKHGHNVYTLLSWICSKQLGFTHKTRIYLQPQSVEWAVTITNL